MCLVARVQNTCGHRNDHVLILCHIAYWAIEQCIELDITRHTILANRIDDPNALREPHTGVDDLYRNGFHATDIPHCIHPQIYICRPEGCMCMVDDCEQAD
ncbi:hypothetical protein PHISCL_04105 [Aspergillus sclerotialis]|uniref:Uncharacterized protein n=1 Tax=Aspergillus sclerotialis TaxID=2070753 RepID=A0A3A2ZK91_9EURO|nr:hypothetical protein PHISCL_04105 [Aspergillus sclerotialis]